MKDVINLRLKQVYEYLTKHYRVILISTAPFIFLYYILGSALVRQASNNGMVYYLIADIFMSFIYLGSLVTVMLYVLETVYHQQPINGERLKDFLKKNILAVTWAVMIVMLFTYVGLILLIIPGIYIFTRLACVPFLVSLDNVKVINAIDLSFEYSRPYAWSMFFSIVIISFIPLNLGSLLALLNINIAGFIGTVIISLTYLVDIILVYHFYLDIKKDMIEAYKTKQLKNPDNPQ